MANRTKSDNQEGSGSSAIIDQLSIIALLCCFCSLWLSLNLQQIQMFAKIPMLLATIVMPLHQDLPRVRVVMLIRTCPQVLWTCPETICVCCIRLRLKLLPTVPNVLILSQHALTQYSKADSSTQYPDSESIQRLQKVVVLVTWSSRESPDHPSVHPH